MEYYLNILQTGTVPQLTITFSIISLIVVVVLPFVLMAVFKKKYGCKYKPFWFGVLVFILFALILESIVNQTLLLKTGFGAKIMQNIWLYSLYGGVMAALFEEFGRLLCMKFLLKDCSDNKHTGLMYGAGHGGCEAVAIFGIAMINNLIYSLQINTGTITMTINTLKAAGIDDATLATQLANLSTLVTGSSFSILVGLVERFLAVALHIALSVLVWTCVKTGKKGYFGLALLMHFLTDAAIGVSAYYLTINLKNGNLANWLTEAVCALFLVLTILLAKKAFKNIKDEKQAEVTQKAEV